MQVVVLHQAGVVEGYSAIAIQENQSWSGAGAVVLEIGLAHGDGTGLQGGVIVLPDLSYVGQFVFRFGVFTAGGISVELGGSENGKFLRSKFGTQLRDDRSFMFAVDTPVSPEEQQHRRAFELSQRSRSRSQIFGGGQGWGGLSGQS